jgi:hypothetical protein
MHASIQNVANHGNGKKKRRQAINNVLNYKNKLKVRLFTKFCDGASI